VWDHGTGASEGKLNSHGAAFRKGREFAAWLGLVPGQYSTGGKARLLGISKRGNTYLRKILVHGARAAVLRIKRDRTPIGAWMDALERRAHRNVLIVAFANKLARIAWAVLSSGEDYRPHAPAAVIPAWPSNGWRLITRLQQRSAEE
jgi:transposase